MGKANPRNGKGREMNEPFNEMKYMAELAEGNPGSMAVLAKIMKEGQKIDPQSSSPILAIGILQESGVTGDKIWELYKDVCGERLVTLLALLRHIQVGFSKSEDIFEPKDMDKMLSEVMAEFTKFNRHNKEAAMKKLEREFDMQTTTMSFWCKTCKRHSGSVHPHKVIGVKDYGGGRSWTLEAYCPMCSEINIATLVEIVPGKKKEPCE